MDIVQYFEILCIIVVYKCMIWYMYYVQYIISIYFFTYGIIFNSKATWEQKGQALARCEWAGKTNAASTRSSDVLGLSHVKMLLHQTMTMNDRMLCKWVPSSSTNSLTQGYLAMSCCFKQFASNFNFQQDENFGDECVFVVVAVVHLWRLGE